MGVLGNNRCKNPGSVIVRQDKKVFQNSGVSRKEPCFAKCKDMYEKKTAPMTEIA